MGGVIWRTWFGSRPSKSGETKSVGIFLYVNICNIYNEAVSNQDIVEWLHDSE